MQFKSTLRFHLKSSRNGQHQETNDNKCCQGCEERETMGGGSVNWYNHYGSQYGDSSKKLKIETTNNQAVSSLSVHPKDSTPMHILL